jgi:maleylacetoacetate isomerase
MIAIDAANPLGTDGFEFVEFTAPSPAGIAQSLAILEYLNETHQQPALLPSDAVLRAHIRGLALHIACDIHPLNNLRVLQYLAAELGVSEEGQDLWYRHWVERGLRALEQGLAVFADGLSLGQRPGYLEACLIPQLYNARRLNCALQGYPLLLAMEARWRSFNAPLPSNRGTPASGRLNYCAAWLGH